MVKRKRSVVQVKPQGKSPEQIEVERRRKRRQTLVRKAFALLRDCGSHVFVLVEDPDGKYYKYKTKKDQNWPPVDVTAETVEDPMLDEDILNVGSYIEGREENRKLAPASSNSTPEPPSPRTLVQPEPKAPFLQPPILEKSPIGQVPNFFLK